MKLNANLAGSVLDQLEPTLFTDLPTETLRAMAVKTDSVHATWKDYSRDMLLAFFHNRHGRYVPDTKENC